MTVSKSSHEFLEHTSELKLRVQGSDWPALLAESGRALGALLLQKAVAEPAAGWRALEVYARDREALLVEWLNEILFLAETERWVPSVFEIAEASDSRVRGRARGMIVDQAPALVKAATFHGLQVTQSKRGLEAEVIFDI